MLLAKLPVKGLGSLLITEARHDTGQVPEYILRDVTWYTDHVTLR